MAWVYIVLAGIFDVLWPFAMKWSLQYSKLGPTIVTIVISIPVSLLLAEALKLLPTGTVYAVFIGLGAVGVTLVGITLFQESTALPRMASLFLVIAGLIGLKLYS